MYRIITCKQSLSVARSDEEPILKKDIMPSEGEFIYKNSIKIYFKEFLQKATVFYPGFFSKGAVESLERVRGND